MLQCHPHPGDFSDKSKPFHCSYFLGLQRKEGVLVNEAKKFDIRLTVDEFKANVGSYSSWKPGMDINVTHIKRRDIPAFVFPGGIRPTRPATARVIVEGRQALETSAACSGDVGSAACSGDVGTFFDGADGDTRKRKRDDDDYALTMPELLKNDGLSTNMGGPSAVTPKVVNGVDQVVIKIEMLDQLTSEKMAIEKLMSGPYESPQELDNNLAKGTVKQVDRSGLQVNGNLEELEAPELDVDAPQPLPSLTYATVASQQKPIMRLSFTSLAKATGNST